MTTEERMIDTALRSWKLNQTRVDHFFQALSEEQLQSEIAPGRNRLVYLWGHLAAIHDAMFPLLKIGPKLFPELDTMFLSNPDRSVANIHSGKELKQIAGQIHQSLWTAFTEWKPVEWLEPHSTVSHQEYLRDPSRNRYAVILNRSAHMSFHLGQAILVRPKR
jgi:hypothetical protein